jgi:protein phosphatase
MALFGKKNNNIDKTIVCGFSDKGRRSNQEDNYLITEVYDNKRLVLVADGVGGLAYGEYASAKVIEIFRNFFVQVNSFEKPELFLSRTVLVAASMLMNSSMQDKEYKDAATTLSGFLIDKDVYYTINVGDSRVYYISGAEIKRMTKDHSYVQYLIDKGELKEEEAYRHPKKNIITSIISSKISDLKTEITGPHKLTSGDILIACTDGFYGVFRDKEILKLVNKNKKKKNIAEIMVKKAYEAGSEDNITVCFYRH